MKKLTELATDADFEELEEILSKVSNSNIVGTLRQAVEHNGEYNFVDIEQAVSESKTVISINEGFIYFAVQNVQNESVRRIQSMWDIVLQRGTGRFVKGEANDYVLTVDLVCNELEGKGLVYCISAIQPVFVSSDNTRTLMLAFPLENARCAKDEVSLYDVEYEAALREESGNEVYKVGTGGEDNEDNNAYDETDDFIGTDEYTVGSSYLNN